MVRTAIRATKFPGVKGRALLRVYFSHHKAASSWIRRILVELGTALRLDVRHLDIPASYAPYAIMREMIDAEQPDIIVINDYGPEVVDTLPPFRGFRVIRDPRDIIVSAYYSHRNSHPTDWSGYHWADLAAHRAALLRLSPHEGLLAEMAFSGPRFIDAMAAWQSSPCDVSCLRMEDLISDPVPYWRQIFESLELYSRPSRTAQLFPMARIRWNMHERRGWPAQWPANFPHKYARFPRIPVSSIPPAYVPWTIARNSFSTLSRGRQVGDEDPGHHYRRGVPGDWRSHFTGEHIAVFRERFGDLAEKAGYHW